MAKASTIIGGYLVEVDGNDCWIDYNDNGAHYIASLAAAQDTGYLEHRHVIERRIPDAIVARITAWASQYLTA
jgi:hypothetical protein